MIKMEEYRGQLINKKYPQIAGKNKVPPQGATVAGHGKPLIKIVEEIVEFAFARMLYRARLKGFGQVV